MCGSLISWTSCPAALISLDHPSLSLSLSGAGAIWKLHLKVKHTASVQQTLHRWYLRASKCSVVYNLQSPVFPVMVLPMALLQPYHRNHWNQLLQSLCNTALQHFFATLLCNTYLQHHFATFICNTSLQHPFCNTSLQNFFAIPLCNTSLQHPFATPLCNTSLQHFFATLLCNTPLQHPFATPLCNTPTFAPPAFQPQTCFVVRQL